MRYSLSLALSHKHTVTKNISYNVFDFFISSSMNLWKTKIQRHLISNESKFTKIDKISLHMSEKISCHARRLNLRLLTLVHTWLKGEILVSNFSNIQLVSVQKHDKIIFLNFHLRWNGNMGHFEILMWVKVHHIWNKVTSIKFSSCTIFNYKMHLKIYSKGKNCKDPSEILTHYLKISSWYFILMWYGV